MSKCSGRLCYNNLFKLSRESRINTSSDPHEIKIVVLVQVLTCQEDQVWFEGFLKLLALKKDGVFWSNVAKIVPKNVNYRNKMTFFEQKCQIFLVLAS